MNERKYRLFFPIIVFFVSCCVVLVLCFVIMAPEKFSPRFFGKSREQISSTFADNQIQKRKLYGKGKYLKGYYFSGKKGVSNKVLFDQFWCTGTCECQDKDSEVLSDRRGVGNIPKSLYCAVSAVSLYVAMVYAKDHFISECRGVLSPECPSDKAVSEIEHCMKKEYWKPPDEEIYEDHISNEGKGRNPDFDETIHRFCSYSCSGHCMSRPDTPEDFDCSKVRVDDAVVSFVAYLDDSEDLVEKLTKEEFLKQYLDDICPEQSMPWRFLDPTLPYAENKKVFEKRKEQKPMCGSRGSSGDLSNIECVVLKK